MSMSGEGFDQIAAGVGLNVAADDAVAENTAAQTQGDMAHVGGCTFHHGPTHGEDVRRLQALDGHTADSREDMPIEA